METITLSEAQEHLTEFVEQVATGEKIIIQGHDEPIAALIGAADLSRLEQRSIAARQLASTYGQDADVLKQIELREIHPVMVAFGLWRGDSAFDTLESSIYTNRLSQPPRH